MGLLPDRRPVATASGGTAPVGLAGIHALLPIPRGGTPGAIHGTWRTDLSIARPKPLTLKADRWRTVKLTITNTGNAGIGRGSVR